MGRVAPAADTIRGSASPRPDLTPTTPRFVRRWFAWTIRRAPRLDAAIEPT
jgi:hypothetical protein